MCIYVIMYTHALDGPKEVSVGQCIVVMWQSCLWTRAVSYRGEESAEEGQPGQFGVWAIWGSLASGGEVSRASICLPHCAQPPILYPCPTPSHCV